MNSQSKVFVNWDMSMNSQSKVFVNWDMSMNSVKVNVWLSHIYSLIDRLCP